MQTCVYVSVCVCVCVCVLAQTVGSGVGTKSSCNMRKYKLIDTLEDLNK